MGATTLSAALRHARERLAGAGVMEAALDSRLLVEHATGTTRAHAITAPQRPVDAATAARLESMLSRRIAGEPVHRIIGERGFYGLELKLSPETLEPRPDTEAVVDLLLPFLRDVARRHGECRILDLGTGTGAIALACLSQVPEATALGTDISPDALSTAEENAERNGLAGRFRTQLSHWFEKIAGRFHAIVSNPPYIRTEELESLQPEVRHFDPMRALDGGSDGLAAYRAIAQGTAAHLEEDGAVALEIGLGQAEAVGSIFRAAGFEVAARGGDLAGIQRAMLLRPA